MNGSKSAGQEKLAASKGGRDGGSDLEDSEDDREDAAEGADTVKNDAGTGADIFWSPSDHLLD